MASQVVSHKKISPKPVATGVKVHPINVGQGDAILLEVEYKDESSKKYLIDGGLGQLKSKTAPGLSPYRNLIATLDRNKCLEKPSSTGGTKWMHRTYRHIKLNGMVLTHPDQDHYGGIDALLGSGSAQVKRKCEKFSVCCPVITTTASQLLVNHYKGKSELRPGSEYDGQESESLQFWFQKDSPGKIHSNLKDLNKNTTVQIFQATAHSNETSSLSTVKLPKSKSEFDYDVVLTGDSYSDRITETLSLEDKHVGIFQVPHHGSKWNYKSHLIDEIARFYSSFRADIYLVSHGDHGSYNHPHSEVITGIARAAVDNDRHCKIVVTATWFDNARIDARIVPKWRDHVDIYCFKNSIPFVTLDPSSSAVPEDLQKYTLTQASIDQSKYIAKDDPVHLCLVCNGMTRRNGSKTAICSGCGKRAHANGRCTVFKKKTTKMYYCVECEGCGYCNRDTSDTEARTNVTCKICSTPAFVHTKCKPDKYTCKKCIYFSSK